MGAYTYTEEIFCLAVGVPISQPSILVFVGNFHIISEQCVRTTDVTCPSADLAAIDNIGCVACVLLHSAAAHGCRCWRGPSPIQMAHFVSRVCLGRVGFDDPALIEAYIGLNSGSGTVFQASGLLPSFIARLFLDIKGRKH
jgi:hypothetical protein